jgi:hypothetical protein
MLNLSRPSKNRTVPTDPMLVGFHLMDALFLPIAERPEILARKINVNAGAGTARPGM